MRFVEGIVTYAGSSHESRTICSRHAFRLIAIAGALLGLGSASGASQKGDADRGAKWREGAVVVLELHDFARVGPNTTRMAKAEVDRIYAATGISLLWSESSAAHRSERRPIIRVYVMHELPRNVRRRKQDVMGVAVNPSEGSYDYIYVDRSEIERALTVFTGNVTPMRLFLSRALGRVIAHELAHLLLDTRRHTENGLLKSSLTLRDLQASRVTSLYFSPQQLARIRRIQQTAELRPQRRRLR